MTAPPAIKAVILDLGRVIVPFEFERAWRQVEQLSGRPLEEIRAAVLASGLMETYERGEVTSAEFARRISAVCGITVGLGEFARLWSSIFLPETLVSEPFLAGLAARYPLVLLSNTNEMHFEMLRETYPLLRHFHARILSYEVGAMKPAEAIYRRAVDATGCRAGECFFTDDIQAYVEGARRYGIDAVQFTGAPQLERELLSRGIRWD